MNISNNKIKAVIFDMDGVLIDAKDWHYDSLNRALNLFGYNINREDHLNIFDGLPTKKKLEMLAERDGLSPKLHTVINRLKQMYTLDLVDAKLVPNQAHQEALAKLKQQGYLIGVASNSIRKTVEVMMEKSLLLPFFDSMLSNEDVKNAKPDPEIYLESAKNLGLKPEECLIVEDNPHGIAAAKASGGRVMEVGSVWDVNYENISKYLN